MAKSHAQYGGFRPDDKIMFFFAEKVIKPFPVIVPIYIMFDRSKQLIARVVRDSGSVITDKNYKCLFNGVVVDTNMNYVVIEIISLVTCSDVINGKQ